MSSKHETRDLLVRYAKTHIPLITIKTDERRRAIEILTEVAEELGVKIYCHTKSKGIYDVTSMQTVCDGESVYEAFDFMREQMKKRSQLTFALSETGDISTETGDAQDLYDLVQSAVDASTTIIVITNKDMWGQLQQTGLVVVLRVGLAGQRQPPAGSVAARRWYLRCRLPRIGRQHPQQG